MVRKLYALPIIGETIHQLEGFEYETALYLNMGYYTIRIFPDSQDILMIVTGFGTFRYNFLHMGMCTLGDIFQAKWTM